MSAYIQIVVFLLGLVAIGKALKWIRFFSRSKKHLSRTMQVVLLEQVVSSAATLIFSVNSLWGTLRGLPSEEWNNIPSWLAQSLRILMFLVMIYSTAKLSRSVKGIIEAGHAN